MIPSDFSSLFLCDFTPTDPRLIDLAREYYLRTERYDRTVCTGPIGRDGIMPMNQRELCLINSYATKVRQEIVHRASLLGFSAEQLRSAMKIACREPVNLERTMATTKRRVAIECYDSRNSIDIYRTDKPEDGFEFQLYLNSTQRADTLMTRSQLVKLRGAIDDILISHISPRPKGAQLAGWHPTEDCCAVLMPDGTAHLYVEGQAVHDSAPLHTICDLARMDQAEYRETIARITAGTVSLEGKKDV